MRKKKVQIAISFGNENVFNEREMSINFKWKFSLFRSKVYYSFSEVIDPQKY